MAAPALKTGPPTTPTAAQDQAMLAISKNSQRIRDRVTLQRGSSSTPAHQYCAARAQMGLNAGVAGIAKIDQQIQVESGWDSVDVTQVTASAGVVYPNC
jgi:hypothetical protein